MDQSNFSNEFVLIYVILIILLLVWLSKQYERLELVEQISSVNNIRYLVRKQEKIEDQESAANLLAIIGEKAQKLINKMKKKYKNSNKRVNRLAKRYDKKVLSESLSNAETTSYSINKGESIVMCIRDKDNDQLIDQNTIFFVLLHELGHLMSVSIGHNNEFWDNFRFILAHAIYWKFYKYENFGESPQKYCGIQITNTPLSWSKYNDMLEDELNLKTES